MSRIAPLAIRSLCIAACVAGSACSNEMSTLVTLDERLSALKLTGDEPEFETTLGFNLLASAFDSMSGPEQEPVRVELEVTKSELKGRPIPLELRAAKDVEVATGGRKATWSHTIGNLPEPVELVASAKAPGIASRDMCGQRVPIAIEVSWKVVPLGRWKVKAPGAGTAKLDPGATAFVDCGPATIIRAD